MNEDKALSADHTLITDGMRCPMPVLRLRRKLADMQTGESILLSATDSRADQDVPAFCRENGHQITSHTCNSTDKRLFVIVKK